MNRICLTENSYMLWFFSLFFLTFIFYHYITLLVSKLPLVNLVCGVLYLPQYKCFRYILNTVLLTVRFPEHVPLLLFLELYNGHQLEISLNCNRNKVLVGHQLQTHARVCLSAGHLPPRGGRVPADIFQVIPPGPHPKGNLALQVPPSQAPPLP